MHKYRQAHIMGVLGAMAGLVMMPEEIDNGGGGPQTPWAAGLPLTTTTQPAPGEIGISPSAVPIEVADPTVYRVPRTDEPINPVPEPVERVAEAPRLHAVEGRDKWNTTPLTTILREQAAQKKQAANPVTGVTMTPATATLAVGATQQLTTVAAPAAASQDFVYSTSDATKATVDQNGLVKAIATGSATITVKSFADETKTDTTVITIS